MNTSMVFEVAIEVLLVEMLDQLGARHDATVVVHHVGEQPVLVRGELDLLAVAGDARRLGVEPQRPALDLALGVAGGAPHLRAHAGEQLLHMEGLGEIVVGARIHAGDLVAPAVAGREDDHRHLAVGAAPLLEDGDAVHFRQADIEDDEVVRLGLAEEEAFLAVHRGIDRIAGIAQRRHQLPVQILVILDHQDAHGLSPSPASLTREGL